MKPAVQLGAPPDASWSDERLVEECRKGNGEAWNALIEKYKNLIYSIPVKLDLHDDATDIFQSVCLALMNELERLREPRALPKWLMQTTYHRCLRHKAQRRRSAAAPDSDETLATTPATDTLPDDVLLQLEREQRVRGAIAGLGERCREMVRLLFFEETPRPYAEIAEQLGLATGSIGFLRGRCLAALRKSLQKAGF